MAIFAKMKRRVADVRGDTSGLALTEFAMSLPVLCLLSITGVEYANYARACMIASQIALSVADNSGRFIESIDETDVDSIFIGVRNAGDNIGFNTNGRVILSMLEHNGKAAPNTGQKITWQRCFGAKNATSSYGVEGDGVNDATLAAGMGPTGQKITAEPGSGIMFVEVVYDYKRIFPTTGFMIAQLSNQSVRYTAAFPVRDRTDNSIKNGFGRTAAQKRTCNFFSST